VSNFSYVPGNYSRESKRLENSIGNPLNLRASHLPSKYYHAPAGAGALHDHSQRKEAIVRLPTPIHILLQDIIDQTAQLGRDIRMLRYTVDSLDQQITYETCSIVALQAMMEIGDDADEACMLNDEDLLQDCQNPN
jgi:hypothetical protein